jgi:lysophospholipase L1-like esterase
MTPLIEENALVLFQGDSITDASRNRQDSHDMGKGYAHMAAAWFGALHPERNVRFLNRGISGNRVPHLVERWEADCLALMPSWVSIMIGINDTWHGMQDPKQHVSHGEYETGYRRILSLCRDRLGARLVLIEPFVLPIPEDRRKWRADLDPRIQIVRNLASEFKAVLVPLDGLFAEAAARREPAYWAPDGVHPTPAGHALIAQAWLRAVRAIPR